MGANATPMNFGEIYTSLQSGVLDGYEHTAATTVSFKFNEVACCIAMTRHLMDPTVLVFSLAEWKKLTPKEQAVMHEGRAARPREMVRTMAPAQGGRVAGRGEEARHEGQRHRRRRRCRRPRWPRRTTWPRSSAPSRCSRRSASSDGAVRRRARRGRSRRRAAGRGDLRASCVVIGAAAGLPPLRAELLAELERGGADLRPHLDRLPRHPDRLPARRAPVHRDLPRHAAARRSRAAFDLVVELTLGRVRRVADGARLAGGARRARCRSRPASRCR